MSDLVARLHFLRAQVAGTARESIVADAIARIKYLEAELAEAILKKKDAIIRWSRLYEEHGDVYRELAEANAKIEAVRVIHRAHSVLTAECVSCRGFFPCRTIRALESATPKPTDNSEDDQC